MREADAITIVILSLASGAIWAVLLIAWSARRIRRMKRGGH